MLRVKTLFRSKDADSEQGFTLIELLVVILIIGILSAIAVPTFLNQRKAATDASIESNAATIEKALNLYYVKHNKVPHQGPLADDGLEKDNNAAKVLGLSDAVIIHPLSKDGTNELQENQYGPWMVNDVFGYRAFSIESDGTNPSCWAQNHTCEAGILHYKISDGTFKSKLVGNPKCRFNSDKTSVIC